MKNYEAPEMQVMEAVSSTQLAGTTAHDLWENSKLYAVVDQEISGVDPV